MQHPSFNPAIHSKSRSVGPMLYMETGFEIESNCHTVNAVLVNKYLIETFLSAKIFME